MCSNIYDNSYIIAETDSVIDNSNGLGVYTLSMPRTINMDPKGLLLFCLMPRSRNEIDIFLGGAKNRAKFLIPLLQAGLILETRPEKKTSRLQRYYTNIDAISSFVM